ncbi:MAG: CoA transferase [Dehalococcoidia bacterium]|nr:CoA transferase [Dehalococcoidia bacterium]
MLPLEGTRVCDLTIAQFGAHATMMLADLGAEVVKIESPRGGDPGRGIALQSDGVSPFFQAHNRGKKSVTVNLRRAEGHDIVRRLAERSAVFAQSWTPGTIERLGFSYEDVRAFNPAVVYASASGFGPHGPRAGLPAMDMVAQATGGLAWANATPDEPWPAGPTLADQAGSLLLACGILAALLHRFRTGEGQRVDVSLLGSQMTLQAWNLAHFFLTGERPRGGRAGSSSPIFSLYRASDGWLAIAVIDERQWPALCTVVGLPEAATDPRFDGRAARERNRPELTRLLDAAFATKPVNDWLQLLEAAAIPCGPVNDYAHLAVDRQVAANHYLAEIDVPGHGPLRVVGPAVELSRTPATIGPAAPELGQHTEEVLLELGYDWPAIERLRAERVVG